jgi:hypothetical protein
MTNERMTNDEVQSPKQGAFFAAPEGPRLHSSFGHSSFVIAYGVNIPVHAAMAMGISAQPRMV